ncbi:hypothetical protein chiPu_0025057, partial [Chiloscyllium punctatum]|nr:hypothetical protein [Chiloscyllium punctatum]
MRAPADNRRRDDPRLPAQSRGPGGGPHHPDPGNSASVPSEHTRSTPLLPEWRNRSRERR